MNISVKYYLKNGMQIMSVDIIPMYHAFPLELLYRLQKLCIIKALKNRFILSNLIIVKIHECGRIKADIY
jgi:hypothetical protein